MMMCCLEGKPDNGLPETEQIGRKRVPDRVIDLTHRIRENMPVYPGTEPPKLTIANTHEADGFQETLLQMYSHTGTHMDAPAHIYPDRMTLDQFPASQFLGTALVIDCRNLSAGQSITLEQLKPYGDQVKQVDFLLFNLGWDKYWSTPEYYGDFPCVDDAVLDLIIHGGYKGMGVDAISIDPMGKLVRHRKLFRECSMVIIENLKDLDLCGDAPFRFSCSPLRYENSDGSPIRAIAWFD